MQGLRLTTHRGSPVADSRDIAALIGKSHGKLLRDIRIYLGYLNQSKFGSVDFFIESGYTDDKGESRPCYLCTRKGCDMIANKMTGKKGVLFTAAYVTRFHEMERELMRIEAEKATAAWQETRLQGKQSRRLETDALKELVAYATKQGSKHPEKLYVCYSTLANRTTGGMCRDMTPGKRLYSLAMVEEIIAAGIREGIAAGKHYKVIYQDCKKRLERFAAVACLPQCTGGNTGSNTIGNIRSSTGGSVDE